jgi:hypothetical protein
MVFMHNPLIIHTATISGDKISVPAQRNSRRKNCGAGVSVIFRINLPLFYVPGNVRTNIKKEIRDQIDTRAGQPAFRVFFTGLISRSPPTALPVMGSATHSSERIPGFLNNC